MRVNDFSVRVVGGHEVAGGYVEMRHGQTYEIQISTTQPLPADALVKIDGKEIGVFRLDALNRSWRLERSPNDQGKFTFYRSGTPEAAQVGGISGQSDNGLIEVTFWPAIPPPPVQRVNSGAFRSRGIAQGYPVQDSDYGAKGLSEESWESWVEPTRSFNYSEGVTGLSGRSDQQFQTVASIVRDESRRTVITLRLVGVGTESNEPRPLVSRGNPVPPPVPVR